MAAAQRQVADRQIIRSRERESNGRAFYSAVFAPAIRKSIANHERYTDMRDRIRKDWEPE